MVLTYINETRLFVDEARYTMDADTVLVDEDGNILAVGGEDIFAYPLAKDDIVDVKEVKNGVVVEVELVESAAATYAEKKTAATNAVAALFEDDTKAALAEDVDQDAIDAAKALVNGLKAADQTALNTDITTAQGFLNAANAQANLEAATKAVEDLEDAVIALDGTEAKLEAAEDLVAPAVAAVAKVDNAGLRAELADAKEAVEAARLAFDIDAAETVAQAFVDAAAEDLTDEDLLEAAEALKAAAVVAEADLKVLEDDEDYVFAGLAAAITAVEDARAEFDALVAVNAATTAEEMKTALDALNAVDKLQNADPADVYVGTNVEKLALAQKVFNALELLADGETLDRAEIVAAIEA